jgi:hypothetical protein
MGEQEFIAHRSAFWRAAEGAQECTVTEYDVPCDAQRIQIRNVTEWATMAHDDGTVRLRLATDERVYMVRMGAERAVALLEGALAVARDAADVPRGSAYR